MNRKQKRMEDIRVAKDKKMKKVAVGLSVVLVIVLALEVPKMLKGTGGPSAAAPAATTTAAPTTGVPTTAPTTAPASTPTGTAAAAVTPVASSKLPNSDSQPKAGRSQLYSFGHFSGKDPFVQQVQGLTAGQPNGSTSSTSATAGNGTTAAVTHHKPRTLAATGAARISINGRVQVVRVGASFPSANPLFRLVSVSGGVARIGIAGGSYSSGAKTVSLASGRTLTLVDTADGIRYRIRLLA